MTLGIATIDNLLSDPNTIAGGLALMAAIPPMLYMIRQTIKSNRQAQRIREGYAAIRQLRKMIEIDPSNAMAYWQQAQIYEMLGMNDQALRLYRLAHTTCPTAYPSSEYKDVYERVLGKTKPAQVLKNHPLRIH